MSQFSPASKGWDLFVRMVHWLVAIAVLFNFFSDTGPLHRWVGYAATGLVLLRLLYGAANSIFRPHHAARLWWPTFHELKHHLVELSHRKVTPAAGHNPLGQYAAYVMWLLILLLGFTGWLAGTDQFWGEDGPIDLHKGISTCLQICVVMHLLGVVTMSFLEKRNLVKAMLTGDQ